MTYGTQEKYEAQLLSYIVDYKTSSGGDSPTIREMVKAVGFCSTSHANLYLDKLAAKGLISRNGINKSRSIRVTGGTWTYTGVIDESGD